jgi:hypothetical protein
MNRCNYFDNAIAFHMSLLYLICCADLRQSWKTLIPVTEEVRSCLKLYADDQLVSGLVQVSVPVKGKFIETPTL